MIIVMGDLVLIFLGNLAAILFRFDGKIPSAFHSSLISFLAIDAFVFLVIHLVFNIRSLSVHFTSIRDMWIIFKAVAIRSLFIIMLFYLVVMNLPRSILLLSSVFAFLALCGPRLTFRVIAQFVKSQEKSATNPVLIIGTGPAGESLCRQLLDSRSLGYRPVGFISLRGDDVGKKIHGIPVLGQLSDMHTHIELLNLRQAIVAQSKESTSRMFNIYRACRDAKIRPKIIPPMEDILSGGIQRKSIRNFKIEDLLPRETISLDAGSAGKGLRESNILVTGAGGSIGSELCRQICTVKPSKLVLFERGENDLFYINLELREKFPDVNIVPVIGDIQDEQQLYWRFQQHKPDVVYHAAAYKHVPLMEQHPVAAVMNNVYATFNLAKVSKEHRVKKFVFISTDKAVNPVNVMGATKRLSEILLHKMGGESTSFISVRFGNVLGSNGSVFSIFLKQIENGLPVTVTHPDVTRYFMTIPEAVQLVLEAGAMGNNGDLFYLDMGEPIRLVDLACNMIELASEGEGNKIDIVYTGLRPGEKLHEELVIDHENYVPTSHRKIWRVRDTKEVNGQFWDLFRGLRTVASEYNESALISHIVRLVPEFHPEYSETISRLFSLSISIEPDKKEGYICTCSTLPGFSKHIESPESGIRMVRQVISRDINERISSALQNVALDVEKEESFDSQRIYLPVDLILK
ncbi:polysaccharide biosynthesis protein [Acidobacteriota bacterium]